METERKSLVRRRARSWTASRKKTGERCEDGMVTADLFDEILENEVEIQLDRCTAASSKVSRDAANLDMLKGIESLRNILTYSVSDGEHTGRTQLTVMFGGDCMRISRTRALLETALSSSASLDDRVPQCLEACVSVEQVLKDLGLAEQLRKAQEAERARILQEAGKRRLASRKPSEIKAKDVDPKPEDLRLPAEESAPTSELAVLPHADESQGRGYPHAQSTTETEADNSPSQTGKLAWMAALQPQEDEPGSTDVLSLEHLDAFLTMPTCLQAQILDREDKNGVTWYKIKLYDGAEERYFKKRYTDFAELDANLRIANFSPPPLPNSGLIGLRHRMDIGGYNDSRQRELQLYLDKALAKFQYLSDTPALGRFFQGANARRSVMKRSQSLHHISR